MTRQGPRSALKANEFIENASIKFSLRVLNDHIISEDILNQLFEFGCVKGSFAERGLGYGKYESHLELAT